MRISANYTNMQAATAIKASKNVSGKQNNQAQPSFKAFVKPDAKVSKYFKEALNDMNYGERKGFIKVISTLVNSVKKSPVPIEQEITKNGTYGVRIKNGDKEITHSVTDSLHPKDKKYNIIVTMKKAIESAKKIEELDGDLDTLVKSFD